MIMNKVWCNTCKDDYIAVQEEADHEGNCYIEIHMEDANEPVHGVMLTPTNVARLQRLLDDWVEADAN